MSQGYKRILFCTDFSGQAAAAFGHAAYLAGLEKGSLAIIHVVPPDPRDKKTTPEQDHQLARELSEKVRATYLAPHPELAAEIHIRRGHPSTEILNQLAETPADLVVMGAQGLSGVKLTLFGSVAERVGRKAPCSCLLVR